MQNHRNKATTKHGLTVVVDASVLRAAGSDEAIEPIPSNCRDTLRTILQSARCAAVTKDIITEWNKHGSRFSRSWRTSMQARRLIKEVSPALCQDIQVRLEKSKFLSSAQKAAGEKDLLLIAAARSADRSILSLDERSRTIYRNISTKTCSLGSLFWANPAEEYELIKSWLKNGTPPIKQLRNILY